MVHINIMMKSFILFLTLSPFLLQTSAKKCAFTGEYFIHVVRFLPEGSAPLNLHCASGDDDLGNHTLTTYGDEYKWSFCDSITHKTLFFCNLHWGSKQKAFDVFRSSWRSRCSSGVCSWAAEEDGIYFSGSSTTPPVFNKVSSW